MNSEIGAKTLTSTGTIQSGRTRLLSIYYVGHASAGTLTFKDGGGSGTQKLVITTPAGSAADQYQVDMPLVTQKNSSCLKGEACLPEIKKTLDLLKLVQV